MEQEIEIWKPINGYENFYEVSNLGNVRSVNRYAAGVHGSKRLLIGKPLIPSIGKEPNNYRMVFLRNGVRGNWFKISRLVAIAFIPNPNNYPCVDHVDCVKTNDSFSNLEWVTHAENMSRASSNGLMNSAKGQNVWNSKLTDEKVLQMLALFKAGKTKTEIAREFQMGETIVREIIAGKRWKHVKRI
jgi:hypothetical protein